MKRTTESPCVPRSQISPPFAPPANLECVQYLMTLWKPVLWLCYLTLERWCDDGKNLAEIWAREKTFPILRSAKIKKLSTFVPECMRRRCGGHLLKWEKFYRGQQGNKTPRSDWMERQDFRNVLENSIFERLWNSSQDERQRYSIFGMLSEVWWFRLTEVFKCTRRFS